MSESHSKESVKAALDAVLQRTNDVEGVETLVLRELGVFDDNSDEARHILNHVADLMHDRGLIMKVVGHRPTDKARAEEASQAGYEAGNRLTEAERRHVEELVGGLEYRSPEEGEAIGREGQRLSRVRRPDLPGNHAWHRYFSYGFWAALRPQDGVYAEGCKEGGQFAVDLLKTRRGEVEEACKDVVRNSNEERAALMKFAEEQASGAKAADRDWMAGWKHSFADTWMVARRAGF